MNQVDEGFYDYWSLLSLKDQVEQEKERPEAATTPRNYITLPEVCTSANDVQLYTLAKPMPQDNTSPVLYLSRKTAQKVLHFCRDTWKHSRIISTALLDEEPFQAIPFTFRIHVGTHNAFEFVNETTNLSLPLTKFKVNFHSSPSTTACGDQQDSNAYSDIFELFVKYAPQMEDVVVTLTNCCILESKSFRALEFLLPDFLNSFHVRIDQCDPISLSMRYFDPQSFSKVTSLSLSEKFVQMNESWCEMMFNHFLVECFPSLRELAVPLPMYSSTEYVFALTLFLRSKYSQVAVTFTNISLLGDKLFRTLCLRHVFAVKDLLTSARKKVVTLGPLDMNVFLELLRNEWRFESAELRKTLRTLRGLTFPIFNQTSFELPEDITHLEVSCKDFCHVKWPSNLRSIKLVNLIHTSIAKVLTDISIQCPFVSSVELSPAYIYTSLQAFHCSLDNKLNPLLSITGFRKVKLNLDVQSIWSIKTVLTAVAHLAMTTLIIEITPHDLCLFTGLAECLKHALKEGAKALREYKSLLHFAILVQCNVDHLLEAKESLQNELDVTPLARQLEDRRSSASIAQLEYADNFDGCPPTQESQDEPSNKWVLIHPIKSHAGVLVGF